METTNPVPADSTTSTKLTNPPVEEDTSQNQDEKALEEKVIAKYYLSLFINVILLRLQGLYDEYHLSDFQKFAVTKFIRENIGKISMKNLSY